MSTLRKFNIIMGTMTTVLFIAQIIFVKPWQYEVHIVWYATQVHILDDVIAIWPNFFVFFLVVMIIVNLIHFLIGLIKSKIRVNI